MYCNQCQETAKNTGCTVKGVCGKSDDVANIQDLIIYVCKGISFVAIEARKEGIKTDVENMYIVNALFMTITNANFDKQAFVNEINRGIKLRNDLASKIKNKFSEDAVNWCSDDLDAKALEVGIKSYDTNEDICSLKQYVTYGLKGMSAYVEHAYNLGYTEDEIFDFIQKALIATTEEHSLDEMLDLVLRTGEYGVKAMALLDKANTDTYGNPEITSVKIGVGNKPGILVTGHDLRDLDELLMQTEGMGLDIYTNSEMLPANAYPRFKKYKHLVGNYGGAWHQQLTDFETFNGPVLFTTNCIVPPRKSSTYNDRIFTTGTAGFPEWKHLTKRLANGQKDFSDIIAVAKTCKAPTSIENGEITIGFAHNQVLALADKILDAVNSGAIKKMVVMSGCDARQKSREYYTEFAKKLPKDTIILTSGCAKYRYNKLNLGDINGIPRVLDAGQCNDSYSWAVVALKLKEVLNLDDINQLPIVFNIAWYEQKAIIVHLALLYLGIKNAHIGPTFPGFFTPAVLEVAKQKFGLAVMGTVEDDLKLFLN
jgi:hydroxylamine reductase